MMIVDKMEIEKVLYDSYGKIIQSYGKEVYYVLYDNNKISLEMAKRILKNKSNHIYDEETVVYMDYIIIVTENQFKNLLEGRLKNREENN